MKKVEGGVTAAKGFFATGLEAGIKKPGIKDMAMVYSDKPCHVAGTFTTNLVKAAPVIWDREVCENSASASAVVVNSGVANACTGAEGYGYCKDIASETARQLNEKYHTDYTMQNVLVASTGVIGKQLPMDVILKGITGLTNQLGDSFADGHLAAQAIMTTDTVEKEVAVQFEVNGVTCTVGGMCKGSGMIHPNMCTMLAFITTDTAISKEMLTKALKEDVTDTYNMISVDGDTSTNDTVLVLANGEAGNCEITEDGEAYQAFKKALHEVNVTLAKKIAGDGEGATALFEVKVIGAESKEQAVTLSKSIVTSSLTKAAIFGHDANWGRILCAMGYSGAKFDPDQFELWFESKAGKILIAKDGTAVDFSEEEATKILSEPEVTAIADIKMGNETATAWGCDLTYDYVKINADYRS